MFDHLTKLAASDEVHLLTSLLSLNALMPYPSLSAKPSLSAQAYQHPCHHLSRLPQMHRPHHTYHFRSCPHHHYCCLIYLVTESQVFYIPRSLSPPVTA